MRPSLLLFVIVSLTTKNGEDAEPMPDNKFANLQKKDSMEYHKESIERRDTFRKEQAQQLPHRVLLEDVQAKIVMWV